MRVVWKDSSIATKKMKTIKYRSHYVSRYEDGNIKGWITDVEGDTYIYRTIDMACNAIDKMLGTPPRVPNEKRKKKGIVIVGTKEK